MTTEAPETALVSRPKYWEIADEIQTWNETLLLVESQIAASLDHSEKLLLVEERGEIQQRLERIESELLAGKTDNLAGVLGRMESDIAAKTKEKDRLAKAIKAEVRALEGLQGYVVKGMETMGKDHLKGALSTITLRGKGGLAPLTISQPDLVPNDVCVWEGSLSASEYQDMIDMSATTRKIAERFTRVPANTLIRAALAEPCADCEGTGEERSGVCHCGESMDAQGPFAHSEHDAVEMKRVCQSCGGAKTRGVPGCSLGERGKSIVIR